MFSVGSITGTLRLEMGQWRTSVKKALSDSQQLRASLAKIGRGATIAATALGLAAAGAAASIAGMVAAAADMEEAENLFVVSMGSMEAATRRWSEDLALQINRSAASIRDGVGNFNVMIRSMGFAEESAATLSKELTKLAFDMSSFYNLPHEEALGKLRAGLSGEAEPLKRLGILINETTVKTYAWANGIAAAGEELTEQQKVLARVGAIMEQTRLAQGDLARTSDSVTNRWRAMTEQVRGLSQQFGAALLPRVAEWLGYANNILGATRAWVRENDEAAAGLAGLAVKATAAAGGTAALVLGIGALIKAFRVLRTVALTAWAAATLPVSGTVAAILAAGAALYALRATWKQNFGDMASITAWFSEDTKARFRSIVAEAKSAAGQIRDAFVAAYNGAAAVISGAGTFAGTLFTNPADIQGAGRSAAAEFEAQWKGAWDNVKRFFGLGAQEVSAGTAQVAGDIGNVFSSTWEQVREDTRALIDSVMPDLGSLLDSLDQGQQDFEGYADLDFSRLLEGIEGTAEGLEGAGKAAKAARQEIDQLRQEAEGIRLSALPAEGLNAEILKMQELSRKFPDLLDNEAVSAQFGRLWEEFRGRGLDAAADTGRALAGVAGEYAESFLAAQKRVEEAITAERYGELLRQISPAAAVIDEAREALEILQDAGRVEDDTNLLGTALWERLRNVSVAVLDEILRKLGEVEGAGGVVDAILDARNAAMLDESIARGQGLAQDINPVASFTARISQDLTDLRNAGRLDGETANLLEADYWRELEGLGSDAIREIIQNVEGLSPAFASALTRSLAEKERFDKAARFDRTANDIMAIGSAVASLGPQFANLGRAARAASAIMGAAAAAMRGDWLSVVMAILEAVDALGLFSDKNEEELHGMAEAMDELGDAVDRWADQLTDAIVEFVRTGKATFKDFVDTVLEELLKIGISNLLVEPIVDFAGDVLFAKGGVVEESGRGVRRQVEYFARGGYVTGGPEVFPMSGNKVGVRGEAGPEAILPLERMSDGRLGVLADLRVDMPEINPLRVQVSNDFRDTLETVAKVAGLLVLLAPLLAPVVRQMQGVALLQGMARPLGMGVVPMLAGKQPPGGPIVSRLNASRFDLYKPKDSPDAAGGGVQVNVHTHGLPREAVEVKDRGVGPDGRRVMDVVVRAVRQGFAEGAFDADMALNFGAVRRG